MFSLVFLLKGSFPRAAPAAQVSCAGLRLSKNLRFRLPSLSSPRSFRKRVQKYYLFLNWQALFSNIFHLFSIILTISEKKVHHVSIFLGFRVVFERKTSTWGGFCGCFHGHRKVFLRLFRGESGRERLGSGWFGGHTHYYIYKGTAS